MKPLKTVLSLALLLGICSIIPSEQTEINCPGQLHSEDSCSSDNNPELVHLAYTCVSITFNGKEDGRAPVVILPGFNAFKEVYMGLAKSLALKTARRVCAVDLRNHGDSPWSDETDSKIMAADLTLFMKTLDTDKIVVVGHSMGGKVAVDFALTYPDKVEKIVVEDMRPNGMSEEAMQIFGSNLDWVRDALNLIPKGSTEYEAKKEILNFYKSLFAKVNDTLHYDESLIDYIPIKCSEDKCSWKPNVDALEKVFIDPLKYWSESSGKSEKPALFIYGEKSMFRIGDVEDEILELFPNAKLHKMKGGSHCLNDYPEYRNVVANFINAKN